MSAPHIEVEGLTVAYEKPKAAGTLVAVSNANLTITRGTFVTIVGPSGCGKSSLLLTIAGLVKPASGCVRVNGKPVSGPGRDRAVVFQDFALMPWRTVIDNVRFGLELQRWTGEDLTERARRYVDLVGLKGFEHYHPHQLSGGMNHSLEVRYTGQDFSLPIAVDPKLYADDYSATIRNAFHELHQTRFGYHDADLPLEIVNAHLAAMAPSTLRAPPAPSSRKGPALIGKRSIAFDSDPVECPVYRRESLDAGERIVGPAIIQEYASTTVLFPQDRTEVASSGELVISVSESE